MPLVDKLLSNIESMVGSLLTRAEASRLIESIKTRRAEFRVPETVYCKFEGDYSLGVFWCPLCGTIYNWREAVDRNFKCPKPGCKGELVQSFLFAPYFDEKPSRAPSIKDMLQKIYTDRNAYCGILNKYKALKRGDDSRPVESLSWYCPDQKKDCRFFLPDGFCGENRIAWTRQREGRGHVRVYHERAQRSALGTRMNFRYQPALPTEGITKALQVSIHAYSPTDAQALHFEERFLPGVAEIKFVQSLTILNFSLAIAVGHNTAPMSKRAILINEEETADGGKKTVILSRKMTTEGLLIRLRGKALNETVASDPGQVSKVLHTVAHAFMKPLPLKSGLDPDEFYHSIDLQEKEIAIYDNEPGGIGGVAAIVGPGPSDLDVDYQYLVASSSECDLECRSACKACLYIENCGWLNRQLNRFSLANVLGRVQ